MFSARRRTRAHFGLFGPRSPIFWCRTLDAVVEQTARVPIFYRQSASNALVRVLPPPARSSRRFPLKARPRNLLLLGIGIQYDRPVAQSFGRPRNVFSGSTRISCASHYYYYYYCFCSLGSPLSPGLRAIRHAFKINIINYY